MSVVDSREDLEAAKARLAKASLEELGHDLGFWAVACVDASAEHIALSEQQAGVIRRYQEAQEWTTLIAKELRSRRDARVGGRPPADEGGV